MRRFLNIWILLLISVLGRAQQIKVPWHCGFEEEEAVEISQWVLNPGTSDATDQWKVGKAVRSERKRSLYISTDGGITASFGKKFNTVMAYRLINLPVHDKGYMEYEVSFDYRQPSNVGTLYVFFDNASTLFDDYKLLQYANSSSTPAFPKNLMDKIRYVSSEMPPMTEDARTREMKNTPGWRNVSITQGLNDDFTDRYSSKTVKRQQALVFVWVNKNGIDTTGIGACIDNVQISKAHIKKPSNLKASFQCADSSVTITWKGYLDGYLVGYRKSTSGAWRTYTYTGNTNKTDFSYTVSGLKDGLYDFRVCGWKRMKNDAGEWETDTTGYVTLSSYMLYCPENQCINYADLDHAECTYGPDGNLYKYNNRIDFGWEDVLSIHTVNTDQEAYDIRAYDPETKEQLKIIPDNAMVSVRIGNWYQPSDNASNPGNAAINDPTATSKNINGATITYDFVVDSANSAILILRYAMVFEAYRTPNHPENQSPYMKLSVLDEYGNIIGGTCGVQYFYCPAVTGITDEERNRRIETEHWHIYRKEDFPVINKDLGLNGGTGSSGKDIWWKDWSTMGLNLSAYDGQALKVVIEIQGCTQSAHYGYGYFTLECAGATIETEQCGETPTATAEAPAGFEYQWYAKKDSALFSRGVLRDPVDGHVIVVSRTPDLTVKAGDTQTYVCHMSYLDSPDCFFELETALLPRNPWAMHTYTITSEQCSNLLTLRDSSRVATYNSAGDMIILADECDYSQWSLKSFVTGKSASFSGTQFSYESERAGDTIQVVHTTYISDGECDNTLIDTIVVPDITTPDEWIPDTICDNQKYTFAGKKFNQTGIYYDSLVNRFGCDSVRILNLQVNPTSLWRRVDTVCSTQLPYVMEGIYKGVWKRYEFTNDKNYVTSDNYVVKLDNRYRCDSTINLELTIIPLLQTEVDTVPVLCQDENGFSLDYRVSNGDFDSLRITFSDLAHEAGLHDTTIYHDPYKHPVLAPAAGQVQYTYPETALPDVYYMYVRFYQHPSCGPQRTDTIPLDIRYANSIIVQKWNDVLALLNEQYNINHCAFTDYQWYKDGAPIEGATKPYLYDSQGLDFNADYTVLLTRATDGVKQFSCPIRPVKKDLNPNSYPTMMRAGSRVSAKLDADATIIFYTLMGAVYSSVRLSAGESSFVAPYAVGYYILSATSDDGQVTKQKILVTP